MPKFRVDSAAGAASPTLNITEGVETNWVTDALQGAKDTAGAVLTQQATKDLTAFQAEDNAVLKNINKQDQLVDQLATEGGLHPEDKDRLQGSVRELSKIIRAKNNKLIREGDADTRIKAYLKQKTAEHPWMAKEYRALAASYTGGGGATDPILKGQYDAFQQMAKDMALRGMDISDPVQRNKYAMDQRKAAEHENRAKDAQAAAVEGNLIIPDLRMAASDIADNKVGTKITDFLRVAAKSGRPVDAANLQAYLLGAERQTYQMVDRLVSTARNKGQVINEKEIQEMKDNIKKNVFDKYNGMIDSMSKTKSEDASRQLKYFEDTLKLRNPLVHAMRIMYGEKAWDAIQWMDASKFDNKWVDRMVSTLPANDPRAAMFQSLKDQNMDTQTIMGMLVSDTLLLGKDDATKKWGPAAVNASQKVLFDAQVKAGDQADDASAAKSLDIITQSKPTQAWATLEEMDRWDDKTKAFILHNPQTLQTARNNLSNAALGARGLLHNRQKQFIPVFGGSVGSTTKNVEVPGYYIVRQPDGSITRYPITQYLASKGVNTDRLPVGDTDALDKGIKFMNTWNKKKDGFIGKVMNTENTDQFYDFVDLDLRGGEVKKSKMLQDLDKQLAPEGKDVQGKTETEDKTQLSMAAPAQALPREKRRVPLMLASAGTPTGVAPPPTVREVKRPILDVDMGTLFNMSMSEEYTQDFTQKWDNVLGQELTDKLLDWMDEVNANPETRNKGNFTPQLRNLPPELRDAISNAIDEYDPANPK